MLFNTECGIHGWRGVRNDCVFAWTKNHIENNFSSNPTAISLTLEMGNRSIVFSPSLRWPFVLIKRSRNCSNSHTDLHSNIWPRFCGKHFSVRQHNGSNCVIASCWVTLLRTICRRRPSSVAVAVAIVVVSIADRQKTHCLCRARRFVCDWRLCCARNERNY